MTITTDRDMVRLMLGDTTTSDPLLHDDEIDVFIAYRQIEDVDGVSITNLPAAAADAAGAIAAKFGRKFSFSEDGQRFDVAQQHGHYLALEASLRRRAGGSSIPYATS